MSRSPTGVERIGSGLLGIEEYATELATRPQFLGLSWLVGNAFGDGEPAHLIADVIVKTRIPAFARVEIEITGQMVSQWHTQHLRLIEQMSSDRMSLNACAPGYVRRCQYFDWCHGSDESKALHYETKGA